MVSIPELRTNPVKRLRLLLPVFMLLPGLRLLATLREVLAGTARGPFHGTIPLVLYSLCLVAFAMIWIGVKPAKNGPNSSPIWR
jgi:hypothetical protein